MQVVARSTGRLLTFAGQNDGVLAVPVLEGIATERPSGHSDLEVILEFPRSFEAASLKLGRFALASSRVMDVSQVVEDPVGGPVVMDPRVEFEGAIAMFEGAVELSHRPCRNPQRHMGVGDPQQTLGVRCCVEGANEVRHCFCVLPQPEAATSKVGQHPGTEGRIGVTALIEPIERPSVCFDGRVESLLDLQHGADFGIDRGVQLRIVDRSRRGSVLQGGQRFRILP